MRSKLFIPGDRDDLAEQLSECRADTASIDFEDTVAPNAKDTARRRTAAVLDARSPYRARIVIRVNAVSTDHFHDDLAVAVHPDVLWINVPKVEDPDECRAACDAIARSCGSQGLSNPIGVIASIESPGALARAREIAAAHPLMSALQISYADLFEPLGISRRNENALAATRFAIKMAASEAGLFVIDGVMPDVDDLDYFRRDAQAAAAMGIEGKSCFDNAQADVANQVFQPSPEDLRRAQRTVEAAASEAARGTGLFELDGRMVDEAYVRGARRILARAQWAVAPQPATSTEAIGLRGTKHG